MSASERLRALNAENHEDADRYGTLHVYAPWLLTALPLIADVVEAAEEFGGEWDDMTRADRDRLERLEDSVLALKEHLEGK